MTTPDPTGGHDVVLFDGVCNLCNASVNFVIDRDRADRFRFAPLQSDLARTLLGAEVPVASEPESVLLVSGGRVHSHSDAALRIARQLGWPWKALWVFIVVPRPLRDLVYRFIARHRYRWFGRTESCRRPTPALKARFLA